MASPSTENTEPTKRRLLGAFDRADGQENAKNGPSPASVSTASSSGHDTDDSAGSKRTRFEDAASTDVLPVGSAGAAEALMALVKTVRKTPGQQSLKLGDGRQLTVTKVTSAEDFVNRLKGEDAFLQKIFPHDTQVREKCLLTYAESMGIKSEYDFSYREGAESSLWRLESSSTTGPPTDVVVNVRVDECDDDDEPPAQLIPKGKWPFLFP